MKKSQLPAWAFILAWVNFLPWNSFAADWRDKAEAEGKLVFYTTANASDTKALTDSFKKIYPKVDVQFERTTDSQMMEKILIEARAGKPLWDVVSTTGFYGYLLKKRGLLAAYDSPNGNTSAKVSRIPRDFGLLRIPRTASLVSTANSSRRRIFRVRTKICSSRPGRAKSASKAGPTNGSPRR